MASNPTFRFAHISDLHFSTGTDQSKPTNHEHSIDLLVGLENRLKKIGDIDRLIVSGDISNKGDDQSLINAHGWIHASIPIGDGKQSGLNIPAEIVKSIPGNHDAWNNDDDTKSILERRQKSLANYNRQFPNCRIGESGCYYDWIEKDGEGIYIAYVDSSFLGDTDETNTESTFGTIRYDQAVAKGKLTVKQAEYLIDWHDQGMNGNLKYPDKSDYCIDKSQFSRSLKILVMHHYLFEPPEKASDYFMRIHHRDIVFRNVAFADFDALLCGHKHIPRFDVHQYGHHFDRRAISRYVINYFRRIIGIGSLPIQLKDDRGRLLSKALTMCTWVLAKIVRKTHTTLTDEALAENVLNLLKDALDDPDSLKKKVSEFLRLNGVDGATILEAGELEIIRKRISSSISSTERKELTRISATISEIVKNLRTRPFLQVMSGSSTKKFSEKDARRSFNVYDISSNNNEWTFVCNQYSWINDQFGEKPYSTMHTFRRQL
jgi:predicted MPP superfamily phosphohydrolase